jgi:hypothetical protein
MAALVAVCVLSIFFFPAMQGPYSVVHGPASGLLATRAALRLRISIIHSALRSYSFNPVSVVGLMVGAVSWLAPDALLEGSSILRC